MKPSNTLSAHYREKNSLKNKLDISDREFHDWYRFVLSYPPQLVRKYILDFGLTSNDLLLDPFCGTGTTLVEAKLQNIPSIGIEANSFVHFASSVKINWSIDSTELLKIAIKIKQNALKELAKQNITDIPAQNTDAIFNLKKLNPEQEKIILKNSISPIPLHKCLVLLEEINKFKKSDFFKYLKIAFGNALVYKFSNLRFGPEVGVGKIKDDTIVVETWFTQMEKICNDLSLVQNKDFAPSEAIFSDSRNLKELLNGKQISAVITSPPYPNEKDYTRTTRLESVILGFINSKEELRKLKKTLLRSNSRGIYKGDDDDKYVKGFTEIQSIAVEIEKRRLELGKTSGFEKLYHKVTTLYFGGIAKHLIELQSILKPGAQLAYVVGDQASFLRIMIPTGKLIAEIAETLGYELVRIDLFRTRFSTATKMDLNEEVVILKWNG